MNMQTEPNGAKTFEQKMPGMWTKARRAVAGFALLVSTWGVAGCGAANQPAAANQGPTDHRSSAYTEYPSPPAQTGNARANVFLGGIAALPDDMELQTIIDRICRVRDEEQSNRNRTTPAPNAGEVETLQYGYNQLYSRMNGLPGPGYGGENWAQIEERKQC